MITVVIKQSYLSFLKRKDVPKLSEQSQKVEDALVPLPLYTCVHVKKDVSAQSFCGKIIIVSHIFMHRIEYFDGLIGCCRSLLSAEMRCGFIGNRFLLQVARALNTGRLT